MKIKVRITTKTPHENIWSVPMDVTEDYITELMSKLGQNSLIIETELGWCCVPAGNIASLIVNRKAIQDAD